MVIDFITTPIWKALGEETDRAVGAETALKRNSFADAEYVEVTDIDTIKENMRDLLENMVEY